jgi:COX assembly mitochondrial protein 1
MNSCMKTYATQAEQDAAREEWFASRLQRQRERELVERKKAEQEDFIREWWGLPERDEERRRTLAEKLAKEEKVGGYARRPPQSTKK